MNVLRGSLEPALHTLYRCDLPLILQDEVCVQVLQFWRLLLHLLASFLEGVPA